MISKCLNILIYHRVLDARDPLRAGEVDINQFDLQMTWVKRFFNVLELSDALDKLKRNELPSRALCITFDDGYRDNYANALPILKKHGFTATFFIATGFLNGGIMWNDVVIEALRKTSASRMDLTDYGLGVYDISANRVAMVDRLLSDLKYLSFGERNNVVEILPALLDVVSPQNLMMDDCDVKGLFQQGMSIGGHTENHPILSKLTQQEAEYEIKLGKNYLENLIDINLQLFAYPNGKPMQDYTQDHIGIVKSLGFTSAVSTAWGAATQNSDVFQLPRFTPWDRTIAKFLARLAKMRVAPAEDRVL